MDLDYQRLSGLETGGAQGSRIHKDVSRAQGRRYPFGLVVASRQISDN
jgi:hypothetical protein